jgi:ribosomal protein L35AE/L33A
MEVSRIQEVKRSDGIERFFPLISLLFSDEVLSFDYVFKCLEDWKTNTTFNFVVLSTIDCNVSLLLEEIYVNLSQALIHKMKSLIAVNESTNKIERVVCFKCKNYGSIICGRDPSVAQLRFICEACKTSTLDPISDLVWSRRCGEISHSKYKQFETSVANIRKELFQVMDSDASMKNILQSMMIIQNVLDVNLVKLLCLFTVKTHRGNQNGKHMIGTIPRIIGNQNAMLSICTAGLDSSALFGKYLHLLYHLFII